MKVITIFDRSGDLAELSNVLEIVNGAWNYFPHKSLGGPQPMKKILEGEEEGYPHQYFNGVIFSSFR